MLVYWCWAVPWSVTYLHWGILNSTLTSKISVEKQKISPKLLHKKQDYQQENNTTDSKHNELIESSSPRTLRNPTRLLKMQAKYQLEYFTRWARDSKWPLYILSSTCIYKRLPSPLLDMHLSVSVQNKAPAPVGGVLELGSAGAFFFNPRSKRRCHQRALFQFKWPSLANFWARLQTTHMQGCAEKVTGFFGRGEISLQKQNQIQTKRTHLSQKESVSE